MPRQKAASASAPSDEGAARRETDALVIGLGGSAGALEALTGFFARMPPDTGMSFVVVQHLERHHPSMLPELLARHTSMPVQAARDGAPLAPDHVFVIPPNAYLTVERGCLRVAAPGDTGLSMPIDAFFRSLAEDQGEKAVGIVLSGTGTDGTSGLRAIKEHGGLTIAQSPQSASHDAMAQSAIAAGLVDHVLPVEQMAARLLARVGELASTPRTPDLDAQIALALPPICVLLDRSTGHDFSRYKEGTLVRRIRRRMQLRHVPSAEDFVRLLEQDPEEPQLLLKDLLIGVTHFFRDPDAFESLGLQVVPRLLEGKSAEAPLRIWVPGCASGEEVYSIAILVRERLARLGVGRAAQIFATDVDLELLATARAGRYAADIAEHVSPERLERFFTRDPGAASGRAGGYQVEKELREMCIISAHNLTRDPPFSSLDLISCRNVLIYFEAELQKKLVPLFHYALRPGGFLFLGPSEGLAGSPELFETLDKRHRIFQRRETVARPVVDFPVSSRRAISAALPPVTGAAVDARRDLSRSFERLILEDHAPCSALVNERGDILFVAGNTSPYLKVPAGALSNNILDHVQANLRVELRGALGTAAQTHRRITRGGISVEVEGALHRVRLTVRPLPGEKDLFAVVVQQMGAVEVIEQGEEPSAAPEHGPAIEQLEGELKTTRADLRRAVEDLESANEEMKSSNEELISTNEELQSANEELQTSKEELQSVNEELETVNTELQQRVLELGGANSDLSNLFASTQIATIFLDHDLRITKFTPAATALFRLIDADVGRPIGDFAPRFEGHDLVADAQQVIKSLLPLDRQVRGANGTATWFQVRILPYRTTDGRVAGVVVTYVDVSELKRAERALRESEERFRMLVEGVEDYAVFMLAADGTVTSWNSGAQRLKGYAAEEILGQHLSRFYPPEDVRAGKPQKELEIAAANGRLEDEGWRVRKDGSRFWANVVITPLRDRAGNLRGFAKVTRDITERKRAEEALDRERSLLASVMQATDVMLVYLDADFNFAWVNAAYADGCKMRPEEMVGKNHFVLYPHAENEAIFRRVRDTGEPAFHKDKPFEFPDQPERGVTYWDWSLMPVKEASGKVQGLVFSLRETTKYKRAELALRASEERARRQLAEQKRAEEDLRRSREGLSRLAEASLRVMRETDLEAMFQAVSAAALELMGARVVVSGHGYVSGQFVIGGAARAPGMPDCPPGKLFLIEKGGVYMELVEGAADTIRLTDAEMRAHPRWWGLPEGHVPMRGLLGVRLVDPEGRTNGMILVSDKEQGDFTAEDESLLRQLATLASLASQHVAARIALEEADKSKNQFLAMLSHELRNPLAPIRNSLYVLDRAAPGGEQAQRAQSVIDRQVTHLARLVDDLLDVTRISRGKIQLQKELIDFADVVRRAVDDHRSFFTENRLELLVTIPDAPLWIYGDRTRIAQVIGNLLQNSAKFAEPGGEATVSVECNLDLRQAVLRVRDTGTGIAPDMLPRIFEPFTQADTTLDRSKGGLGLGLALVKGLVEMHGGTVSVESEGVGKGAEFTVRLPLESGVAPTAERTGGARQNGSARRVLVIEDNVDAADSLREVLELEGHTVEVAYSGADGIETARAFRPEVVLCDIGLPGMDGYEVTKAMRADEALRSTFLVALSGYALSEDLAKAKEAGFDRHLAKPPSLEKLTEILASAPSIGSTSPSVEEPDSSRGG